jgi:hypothetical protein
VSSLPYIGILIPGWNQILIPIPIPIPIPPCFDSDSDSTLESNRCFKDLVGRENVGELALKLELELELEF